MLGITVVLMGGTILDLNCALEKNATGVDLKQLFIGSEGTLGVITEATLKLAPLPRESQVLLLGLPTVESVFPLFQKARNSTFQILAFEYFSAACMRSVCQLKNTPPPFHAEAYVLMEIESHEHLENWLESLLEETSDIDGLLCRSSAEKKHIWSFRESITESLAIRGRVHKNDIALPLRALPEFFSQWPEPSPDAPERFIFGHIGDGNLHISTLQPPSWSSDAFEAECARGDTALYERVQQFRGSVSAEHGIGLLKKKALHYSRSALEISMLRALKQVFDPDGLLNPGKILMHESHQPSAAS